MLLTSPDNPHVRAALQLHERKYRRQRQQFLIEGLRFLRQAVSAHASVRMVFVTGAFAARADASTLLDGLRADGAEVLTVSDALLRRVADTETPQGIVAVVDAPRLGLEYLVLPPTPLVLVCDAVQDPGNIGALVRVADAAGAQAVLALPGSCEIANPKALRATMGSIFSLPVMELDRQEDAVFWLGAKSIRLVVATPEAQRSCFEFDYTGPVAVAVGNEARGISPSLKAAADARVHIPMLGGAESLNVTTAGTVLLYEAARQRLVAQG